MQRNQYREDVELAISRGATVCKKLKIIYPEKSWMDIAVVFTNVKKKIRILYDGKTEPDFLKELEKFSVSDLQEAIASQDRP